MGLQIDPDPRGLMLAAGLEYAATNADFVQAKCCRQTANSAADQEHFHRDNLPTMLDESSGQVSQAILSVVLFTSPH